MYFYQVHNTRILLLRQWNAFWIQNLQLSASFRPARSGGKKNTLHNIILLGCEKEPTDHHHPWSMNKNLFGNRSIPSFSWHSSHQLTVSTPPPPPTMTHRPSPCLTNISSADGSDRILALSSSYVLISFAIFWYLEYLLFFFLPLSFYLGGMCNVLCSVRSRMPVKWCSSLTYIVVCRC